MAVASAAILAMLREMRTGELIAGRFLIEAEAGSGGLGVVYRCRDTSSGEHVAIKVLDKAMVRHRDRFLREAELLATLVDAAIVRHISHGLLDSGAPYLVMQWIEGEDLMHRLEREHLTLEHSFAIGKRVASALAVAHERGIVHRDVKPANVLLPNKDPAQAVLIDFGIARAGNTRMTVPGGILGTPGYMAPEQARGDSDLDARADVFSLGCVLFECLTGKPPFDGESTMAILAKVLLDRPPAVHTLKPEIPRAVSSLVERAMAKAKEERPADARAFLRELEAAMAGSAEVRRASSRSVRKLTTREQRILSIIVARLGAAPRAGDTLVDGPSGSQVRALAEESSHSSGHERTLALPANVEAVRGAATGLGSRVELLLDGSLIALVEGDSSAVDQATRAVRCALAMRDVCDPGTSLVVATGRGELAGQLPVGDVIDRAFAIVRSAKGDGVRLDELTARLVSDRFEITGDEISPILVGELSDEVPSTMRGRSTPCVGRDREITDLISSFDACRSERTPHVVLVTGEPGIGKSRVRSELVTRLKARREPFVLLMGGGDPARAGAPFAMLRQALRRELGVREGDTADEQREHIRARVGALAAPEDEQRLAASFGEIVGVPFPDVTDPRVLAARNDRQLMGDVLRAAWQDFLEAEAEKHPVVIVLEDLHCGDRPSVDFALSAARALRNSSLLVLMTAQPEARVNFADLFALHPYTELALGPLSRRACEELGRAVLADAEPSSLEEIGAQSAGNPFFIEELLRARVEGRKGVVPDTVLAMAQARIDALPVDARRAARAASVLGEDLCDEGLAALLSAEEGSVARWVAELLRAELIVRRSGAPGYYDFRQSLFRDAANASLTAEDRVTAHALAAAWLDKRPDRNALALASHFEEAQEPTRACTPYAEAAAQAVEGNDLPGAIQRGERALACGAEGELRGRIAHLLAQVHRWRGEHVRARSRAEEAAKFFRVGSEAWIDTQVLIASAASIAAGDNGPSLATAATLALALEAGDSSAHVVSAAARVARMLLVRRIGHATTERLLKSLRKARKKTDDPRALGFVLRALAVEAELRQDLEEALELLTASIASFEQAGDARTACDSRSDAGFYLLEMGQYERVTQQLRALLNVANRMGLVTMIASAHHNLGPALFETGDVEGAIRSETLAIEAYASQGDKRLEGGSRYYYGLMLLRLGRLDEAEREMRNAVVVSSELPSLRVTAEAGLARVLVAQGKADEALALARRAHAPPEPNVVPELPMALTVALLEALVATGNHDEARTLAGDAAAGVVRRAQNLRAAAYRESMLERVPENARTLAIAQSLGLGVASNG